ncbi:MAG: putative aconitase with swiveling domain [Parasphingorhabdus sp.]|jgi:predicted aconitase with swiveling domain
MTELIELRCHVGVGPVVTGEALVTDDNFSARYDLDRIKGIFSRPQHKLAGQSYVDKVLVFNTAKGGVASAWMLHEMTHRGVAPKAILFNRVNPILAQGGALANMALCDRFEAGDVTQLIKTGDVVTVDPDQGMVLVKRG